jgi:hypothetical protein
VRQGTDTTPLINAEFVVAGDMVILDSLIVFIISLLIGALGIYVGARVVAGIDDYTYAIVTALIRGDHLGGRVGVVRLDTASGSGARSGRVRRRHQLAILRWLGQRQCDRTARLDRCPPGTVHPRDLWSRDLRRPRRPRPVATADRPSKLATGFTAYQLTVSSVF